MSPSPTHSTAMTSIRSSEATGASHIGLMTVLGGLVWNCSSHGEKMSVTTIVIAKKIFMAFYW